MVSKKPLDVKIILNESYIKTIKNSVGSNLFRNLYAYVDGNKTDILRSGKLSCAIYISSILHRFKLTNDIHATVEGTVKDLKKSGWQKVKRPRLGAILVWEPQKVNDRIYWRHDHIGFYIGKNRAISSDFKRRQPILHHWTFGVKNGRPVRKIEQILWNKKLDK